MRKFRYWWPGRAVDGIIQCRACRGEGGWWIERYRSWRQCGNCGGAGWLNPGQRRVGHAADHLVGPYWGRCLLCETPWALIQGHATDYSPGRGMFPLCEPCWAELTPRERLPFYKTLHSRWARETPADNLPPWDQIEHAVLSGK